MNPNLNTQPGQVQRMSARGVPIARLQSAPTMPPLWTPAIAAAAMAHAQNDAPNEAIGCITADGYVPLANVSKDPANAAQLSNGDMVTACSSLALYHSHPDGLACPSESDMRFQQQMAMPFIIQPLPFGEAFAFGDELERAPLVGRGFRHGVHDCWSCCRDWFHAEAGIELINPPRGWEWWNKPGFDLYGSGFEAAGFRAIPISEAVRPGDGLLLDLGAGRLQHAAVVLDRDTILHHLTGRFAFDPSRPSARTIRSRFVRFARMAVRHTSL